MPFTTARITTLEDDGPYDANQFAYQDWDRVESPTSYAPPHRIPEHPHEEPQASLSTGFDPNYPFSPAVPSTSGGFSRQPPQAGGRPSGVRFEDSAYHRDEIVSPENAYPTGRRNHIWSPVSPPAHQETFASRYQQNSGSDPISSPPFEYAQQTTTRDFATESPGLNRSSLYSIPIAPPPPDIPTINEDTAYDGARISMATETNRDYNRWSAYSEFGRRATVNRSGSIRRLGTRLVSSVSRSGNRSSLSRFATRRRNRDSLNDDIRNSGIDYMELGNVEEGKEDFDPIEVDISSFGPEFVAPTAAVLAMKENNFNDEKAYTGTGEAVDLSNLVGWDDFSDTDSIAPATRAGTFEVAKQSYYFPPDRDVPNWKPIALRNWFLILLILSTIALLIATEVLYRLSDNNRIREDGRPGLFSYKDITKLPTIQFAVWKYVPTIIGVIYGIVWKVTDEGVKRGEPYYQLTKGTTGALAAESLNIEYHTLWAPFVPISAFKHKQFIVVAASTISFLASGVVPILLSVMIRVHPNQKTRKKMIQEQNLEENDIEKNLVVDVLFTRSLEAFLGIILILACYTLFKLSTRKSGLLWDPSGIAGVAAMANKSHILHDFKDLDLATEEQIHQQLNKRTYILHRGVLWHAQSLRESERDHAAPKALNPHPLLLRKKGMMPFIGFNLFILIMLPLCVYIPTLNVVIDKAPWVITGISIFIKTVWELVEKDLRMLEPWWILYRRYAPSTVLTLDYTATIPGAIVIKALMNRHMLLAWVTTVTLMIEVLTVVLGSLDTEGGEESVLSSTLSFALAIVILVILMSTCFLVIHQRGKAFLPRQPGTISSVLAFIYMSHWITELDGTENKSTAERQAKLAKTGKKYGFGWYRGRDGKRHLGVEHEQLLEDYKFRVDPRKAVVDGPLGGYDVYEERR
ncbi:hypothetical protein EX30DRAFT_370589 [Ascodesmis nigricans]|uniref:Uncharacterized protein n=1 Tax=Ascodesmis nigricans TaxID=341454 RepID=A0A4S2N0S2_9PEZI|nr:hypothetical protein EX30DRAFT_370589 [Ascodesmis nigricans]